MGEVVASVIIPATRPEGLTKALQSLEAAFAGISYEVLIADSTLEGLPVTEWGLGDYHTEYIFRDWPRRGCIRAMNDLWRRSKGVYLVPFSDDAIARPGSFHRGITKMENEAIDLGQCYFDEGGGCQIVRDCANFPILRNEFMEALGGFNEVYTQYDLDAELYYVAMDRGAKVRALTGCCLIHERPTDEVRDGNRQALDIDFRTFTERWDAKKPEIHAKSLALRDLDGPLICPYHMDDDPIGK